MKNLKLILRYMFSDQYEIYDYRRAVGYNPDRVTKAYRIKNKRHITKESIDAFARENGGFQAVVHAGYWDNRTYIGVKGAVLYYALALKMWYENTKR
jgi:hypothetical protein